MMRESTDSDAGGSAAAEGDRPYIALVSKGFQHQFWQAVKAGAEQAAEEFDVEITFEGPNTEADVDQQIQMLQTALDKSPAAIGFAALDSQAAGPLLQQAKDQDIPVIAFDSGVDSDIPLTTAATDNLAAAAEAASIRSGAGRTTKKMTKALEKASSAELTVPSGFSKAAAGSSKNITRTIFR